MINLDFNIENYKNKNPFPYAYIDNFLNTDFALKLQQEILNIPSDLWDRYQNPFEEKFTLRNKYNFPKLLQELFMFLESDLFVKKISVITGFNLELDPNRNFWGVHKYISGDKLDIHVDAGLHPLTKQKKQVTLGIYLSHNWLESYKCNLEIWKGDNSALKNPKLDVKIDEIAPIFNRMILFTCNDYSWHGNPERAVCPSNSQRIFITISYLSNNLDDLNKRVKALFIDRPNDPIDEEKNKLRILRADPIKFKEIYNTSKN